jgi:predicted acylesterase/phospholipase RssA
MATIYVIQLENVAAASRFPNLFPKGGNRHIASETSCDLLRTTHVPFTVVERVDTEPLEKRIVYPLQSFLYSTPERGAIDEICAKILASEEEGKLPYAIFLGRNINLQPGAFILDRAGGKRNYQWRLSYTKEKQKSMEETFPKFLRLVSDFNTKFVISFGSGGLRLFCQPSMMKFINGIKAKKYVSEVWGCSGGAISALCFSMGVEPEAIEQKGYDIYNERFQFKLAPSAFVVAKNTILSALMPTPPNVLKGFISAQETMQKALTSLIGDQKIEIPFYCVAYNVKRRRNEILTPLHVTEKSYQDIIVSTTPIDAVIASSSIPVVYVPKAIQRGAQKETYIDGATAEPVPLLSIYRKWLIDRQQGIEKRKLVILAIDPMSSSGKQSWIMKHVISKIPFAELARFGLGVFGLMMRARINNQIEVLKEDKNVKVLIVSLPLSTSTLLDIKKIPTIIQDAQTVLLEQMLKMEESL